LDESLGRLEPLLRNAGFLPTHLPMAVPQSLAETVGPHLSGDFVPTRLSTRSSDRRRGWHAVSGLCLQALPLFAAEQLTARQLPFGVYSVGPSAHALEGWRRDAVVDMVAVHGLVASLDASSHEIVCDLADGCVAGLEHRATADSPLLPSASGRLLRSSAGVLAHVVTLPPALVAASKVSCVGPDGRPRRPVLTSVYLSQLLLAALPGEAGRNGA
jgi:hypothetical protein